MYSLWLAFLRRKLPRTVAVDTCDVFHNVCLFPSLCAASDGVFAALAELGRLACCKTLASTKSTLDAAHAKQRERLPSEVGLSTHTSAQGVEAAPMRDMNL